MKNKKSWWLKQNEETQRHHDAHLSDLIDSITNPQEKQCCGHCDCNDELEELSERILNPRPKSSPLEEILNPTPKKTTSEKEVNDIIKDIEKERLSKEDEEAFFEEIFSEIFEEDKKTTLVVNLFGGPCAGKSKLASGIIWDLKQHDIDCELANEYAKDLVYEKRNYTFANQIYLFAKQHHRVFRLLGQVDVIVTDSPFLLYPVYDSQKRQTLKTLAAEEHDNLWTYNVFVKRGNTFTQKGRLHNKKESEALDREILQVMDDNNLAYETFSATNQDKNKIVNKILSLLKWQKTQK